MTREQRNIVRKLHKDKQVRVDAGTNDFEDNIALTKKIVRGLQKEDGLTLNKDFVHRQGNLLMLTDTYIARNKK